MIGSKPLTFLREFNERESLRPDLSRAIRGTLAVIVPLILAAKGWLPLSLPFVVFAAQSVAIVDVRGAYTLRFGLLVSMTLILGATAGLGEFFAADFGWAIVAAGLVAASGGLWRHVTPDYGTSLAVSSTLLFLISVSSPSAAAAANHHGASAIAGGLWGVLLQVANWPINPQHPLRRAVSDSWVAVADLFQAINTSTATAPTDEIQTTETNVRTTVDHAYAALGSARATPLRTHLEELNLAAARLATRVMAFHTALQSLRTDARTPWVAESLQPLLTSLTNTSRSVAVTLVSGQPAHLTSFEIRLQRLGNLLTVFHTQAPLRLSDATTAAQLRDILGQLEAALPGIHTTLRATIDRAGERTAFSLELFDLQTWTLRPLASSLNFSRHFDPVLLRFTARVSLLTMLGVAAVKHWHFPHGYWFPLTMLIVLQPDYGSTRLRAAQRVLGTLAGSVAASLFLWLHLPFAALAAACSVTVFGFGFFLKRNYPVAVFFITLVVVLLTEANQPVTWWFTLERLGSTFAGGVIAWLAALFLWPVWERQRLPGILADALDANRDYLRLVAQGYEQGGAYDAAVIAAKRKAETANSAAFASLQRMTSDPRGRRKGLDQLAALANGNQRITRALTVMALHLQAGAKLSSEGLPQFFGTSAELLHGLAQSLRDDTKTPAPPPGWADTLNTLATPAVENEPQQTERRKWVVGQSLRIATELAALQVAAANSGAAQF